MKLLTDLKIGTYFKHNDTLHVKARTPSYAFCMDTGVMLFHRDDLSVEVVAVKVLVCDDYGRDGGFECPNCCSSSINLMDDGDAGEGGIYKQIMVCDDCERTWTEEYHLKGISCP